MKGVHESVLESLGRRIAAGIPPPGTVFTLADLEAEFSASRTAVREAVRVLDSMRMVSSRRHVGINVRPRHEWDALAENLIRWNLAGPLAQQQLEALLELRVAVEPLAARLAAERSSDAQRAELLRLATVLHTRGSAGCGNSPDYLQADLDYHSQLLAASGNPLFAVLAEPVRLVLTGRAQGAGHHGKTPPVPHEGTLEEHLRTAQAIVAGDAAEAERHARAHLETVWSEVRD